jgi:hypothetical protein
MKYDRRLVARNSLTDLEAAVKALEAEGWELDPTVPDENSGTILGALRALRGNTKLSIPVPMRIAIGAAQVGVVRVAAPDPVDAE